MTHAQKEHGKAINDVAQTQSRLDMVQAAYAALQDKDSHEGRAIARKVTLWQSKHMAARERRALWRLACDAEAAGIDGEISMIGIKIRYSLNQPA